MKKNKIGKCVKITLFTIFIIFPPVSFAQSGINYRHTNETDSVLSASRFIHRIGVEARPGYIFPTNSFLDGENVEGKYYKNTISAHVRYSFQHQTHSLVDQIYKGAYQGIGLSYYNFGEREYIGNPVALYVFQGARIARLHPQVSLNYEWNFGLSFGWKPYDSMDNSYNIMMGSKTNAYLNANLYLNWMISKQVDFITGFTLSHFSNGNTNIPNAGMNMIDFKIGLVYNINREENALSKPIYFTPVPKFPRHISYDLVMFGSWRRKGVQSGEDKVASPHKYTVLGFNFSPMYNFGYRFRAGVSLDGMYDGSANVYTEDYIVGTQQEFFKPSFDKQIALGLSGRAEYVMPYFTVGVGMGVNVFHRGGDLKALYQTLSLKMEITRNSFLHVGYRLNDFHDPNYLMLGIGYRFNNKTPKSYR